MTEANKDACTALGEHTCTEAKFLLGVPQAFERKGLLDFALLDRGYSPYEVLMRRPVVIWRDRPNKLNGPKTALFIPQEAKIVFEVGDPANY